MKKEVENSNNTYSDEHGTTFSCHYNVSKNDANHVLFNGYNKMEILDPRLKGLNLYARLSYGRFKVENRKDTKTVPMSQEALEAFFDIIKCPI